MTIGAQQLQVSGVSRPILETASPCVTAPFRANFGLGVDVVYIESAVIFKSALNTFAAKLLNQFKFALPVARALMDAVSVLVPVVAQTAGRAKAVLTFLAARFAFASLAPTVGQIASLSAILRALMPTHRLAAMFASIHGFIIPKYLACERITNAQRQTKLFDEPKAKPEQQGIFP